MNILITGITGVIGSHLISCLVPNHNVYALVRNAKYRTDRLGLDHLPEEQIIEGDLRKEGLGLSPYGRDYFSSIGIDAIVHCAGSVKFHEKYQQETWEINVDGTHRLLELARELDVKEFHFLSTAYAPMERNPYEKSKMAAEELVINSGLPFNIYRLGIAVGEEKSCRINAFNGFYGYFMLLYFLAQSISTHSLYLPVTIRCSFDSPLNIVPIDWLVQHLTKLIERGVDQEMYHLTHHNPPLVNWVIKTGFESLNIEGVKLVDYLRPFQRNSDQKIKALQNAVDKAVGIFFPYATNEPIFCLSTIKKKLNSEYEEPPIVTNKWINDLLKFALEQNFGRPIRKKEASIA